MLNYQAELLRHINVMLHPYWATGDKIKLLNETYHVGKMSYGDYFIEPDPEGRETEPFNPGTIWPRDMTENELEGLAHTLNALRK